MLDSKATKRLVLWTLFSASNRIHDRIEKAREANDWDKHKKLVAADARILSKIEKYLAVQNVRQ